MTLFYVYLLTTIFVVSGERPIFLPNLPVGKYRVVFEALHPCGPTNNHKLAFNIHFSKKSLNETEITGNVTYKIPFDDSVIMDLNAAIMGSTGGWKNSAYVFKSDKSCSNTDRFLGKGFASLKKAFGINATACPIPPGVYVSSGMDVMDLENNNFPKEFFYGKYKTLIKFENKQKELLGCLVIQMNIKRPWE